MQTFGRVRWLVATATAALGLAAVGPAAAADGTFERGSTVKVAIHNFAFHPAVLHVAPGTRVVFVNRDATAHDATRRGSFGTGLLRPGDSAAVRFGRRGSFSYVCSLH